MALVKFAYANAASDDQIARFDVNTIYFIGGGINGGKLYKGPNLFDAGAVGAKQELMQLKAQIGTIPISDNYKDLIEYIDKNLAATNTAIDTKITAYDKDIKAIAKTGEAVDIHVKDSGLYFVNDNLEGVMAEVMQRLQKVKTGGALAIQKVTGGEDDDFVVKYVFTQGENEDLVQVGEIEFSKDILSTTGELVRPTPANPLVIDDEIITSGAYIKMAIGTGTPFYINVADLIEYNTVTSTDEIILTDANHTVTATIGEISSDKIIYQKESGNIEDPDYIPQQTVTQAIDGLKEAVGEGVDEKIEAALGELDANVTAGSGYVVTGVQQTDGKVSGVDKLELTATNVSYPGGVGRTNVGLVLDTIGRIPSTANSSTVVDYITEVKEGTLNTLNADVDAVLAATDRDRNAVPVVSGITEQRGIITSVDSRAVDVAGAATTAESNAKQYTNEKLTWLDLSGTPTGGDDTPSSGGETPGEGGGDTPTEPSSGDETPTNSETPTNNEDNGSENNENNNSENTETNGETPSEETPSGTGG